MTNKTVAQKSFRQWAKEYPTLGALVVLFLSLLALSVLFPTSGSRRSGDVGFTFMLFALGAYTVVSTIRGFISIFNRSFLDSSLVTKVRALFLSFLLLIPCLGIVSFVVVAFNELTLQMRCAGAGCAQGGMATMAYLVIAWVSYVVVLILSTLFEIFKWWPTGMIPKFRFYD